MFRILHSCNPHASPLLPRVKHLDIRLDVFASEGQYQNLVNWNALESICVIFCRCDETLVPDSVWNEVSSLLLLSATVIKYFHLRTRYSVVFEKLRADVAVHDGLLNVYRNFRRLEVFDARSSMLTHNTLAHFAALSTLRAFRFSIGAEELKGFVDSNSSKYIFMELTDFVIQTDDLEEATRLVEQKGFGRLEHLTVCRGSMQGFWTLDPFFKALQKQAGNMPLTSLRLIPGKYAKSDSVHPLGGLVPKSGVHTFVPLFEFTDMTVLEIDMFGSVDLNDSGLIDLANAWPRLEILKLCEYTRTMPDAATGLTIFGLLPLVASCINLRELTIRVDARNAIPDAAQLRNIGPALKLRCLNVSRSPANDSDVTSISYFIKTVFPNLRTLSNRWNIIGPDWHYREPVEEENLHCWEDIQRQSVVRSFDVAGNFFHHCSQWSNRGEGSKWINKCDSLADSR